MDLIRLIILKFYPKTCDDPLISYLTYWNYLPQVGKMDFDLTHNLMVDNTYSHPSKFILDRLSILFE